GGCGGHALEAIASRNPRVFPSAAGKLVVAIAGAREGPLAGPDRVEFVAVLIGHDAITVSASLLAVKMDIVRSRAHHRCHMHESRTGIVEYRAAEFSDPEDMILLQFKNLSYRVPAKFCGKFSLLRQIGRLRLGHRRAGKTSCYQHYS